MRRKDREITELSELQGIVRRCQVCRVALNAPDFPYIVPLSFGEVWKDGKLTLYFHCARAGRKLELMERNPRVGFALDRSRLKTGDSPCQYTAEFESVIGGGVLERVPEEEKEAGLAALMRHYSDAGSFSFEPEMIRTVEVLKLTVTELAGKRNFEF